MAKSEKAPSRRPRPKQGYLADMEPPSIPALDRMADELAEVRGERMRLTERETNLADLLLIKMKEHGLKTYTTSQGKKVDVVSTDKIKVRRPSEENGEAE